MRLSGREVPSLLVKGVSELYADRLDGTSAFIVSTLKAAGMTPPTGETFEGSLNRPWNRLEARYPAYGNRIREFRGALNRLDEVPNIERGRETMSESGFFVVRDETARLLLGEVLLNRVLVLADWEKSADAFERTEMESVWQGTGYSETQLRERVMLRPSYLVGKILDGAISWFPQTVQR